MHENSFFNKLNLNINRRNNNRNYLNCISNYNYSVAYLGRCININVSWTEWNIDTNSEC